MQEKNVILTKERAMRKLQRMALEVAERNNGTQELVLAGIRGSGSIVAKMIASYIGKNYNGNIDVIELNINKKNPLEVSLEDNINLNGKTIILIDDVANSGRTMLYAIQPLLSQMPAKIQTLALVERTHKLFPVAIDYVGLSVSTTLQENIVVEITGHEVAGAYLV